MNSPVYKISTICKRLALIALFLNALELRAQVLTCPDDYTIQLPQNLCGIAITYDTLEWSATIPVNDPVFFPFPGTTLPTGTTTVTLAVADNNNNFYTCDFLVTILGFQSTNFNCPSQVSVSLAGECERPVTASDVLGNPFNPCDEDYVVETLDGNGTWIPAIIDAEDVGYSFNIRLTNFETGHSCETIMTVTGGEPASITCPPNIVQYCNEPTDPSYVGYPELTGCFEDVDLSYVDDLAFTSCPDTLAFQISRTWVAVSPNGSQYVCEHSITGRRFPVSQVVFPQDYDGIAQPKLTCSDSLNLTQTAHPDITGWPLVGDFLPSDNIHCKYAVSYVDNITQLCGDSYRIKRAWSVVQLCGPITVRDTQTIIVADEYAPAFELLDTLYFSNSGGCVDSLLLPAANLISECSGYSVQIESAFGNFLTNGAWITPDTLPGLYPVSYTFTDQCGNDSTQVLTLKITDETLVSCPANDTINCDYYFTTIFPALQTNNFDIIEELGLPTFYSNCSFDIAESDSMDVNDCGNGNIIRHITATNTSDTLECTQIITVQHLSNFEVLFPADLSICVSPVQADLPEPVLSSINCEEVTTAFTDMIVPSGITGCYDIHRNWVVTNVCIFNGTPNGMDEEVAPRKLRDNGDGYVQFTQIIHVNNNAPIAFPNGCEIPDHYTSLDDCTAEMLVPTPAVSGCGNVVLTVTGSLGNSLGAPVSMLPGTYIVTYKATDECNKMQTCVTSFEVFDTVAPMANCKPLLTFEAFGPSCAVDVFASDFNDASVDNCDANLTFSFSENEQVIGLTLDYCDYTPQLTIWATDDEGNKSSCTSNIFLQSTLSACECYPILGGKIETEAGLAMENATVAIEGSNGFVESRFTDSDGVYSLNPPEGADYLVAPAASGNPRNGVTTFDQVIIRKHILGVDTLDTPYKMIAADINNSGTITTFDLVEQRKIILQIYDAFPDNTSWRFIPKDFVFPNPTNPFSSPFPETVFVEDFNADRLDVDFIAIKIGDVNDSASPMP